MIGTSISVTFTVDYPITFNTWVGRFVNRIVSEVLEGVGYRVSHASVKPFTTSPILDLGDRVVRSLAPGSVYRFRVSLFCNEVDCGRVVDGFTRPEVKLSSGEVLRVIRVNVGEVSLNVNQSGDSPTVIRWGVRYWPTLFIFRSYYITWPSPARFLASSAQTLSRLIEGSRINIIHGDRALLGLAGDVDLRQFVKDLMFNTDVIRVKVRGLRLNLGGGRWVRAFSGHAEYVTYTEKTSLFKALLNVANAYGVGKDRALGLGYVNVDATEEKVIKRQA
ncbi:MAG: CRISPR system precrRNA processing endoribonuclease RAMP protein Cas6 [Caldivirga sp.]|uniref:CRISPR system precrRNA processing endoribonuclease RAMP protein Cas6 n=1 Tax=Caldivirga sp. TaxID=2080243 RepID=UPI003D149EDF